MKKFFTNCAIESRCSFRHGERNRKPPGEESEKAIPPGPPSVPEAMECGCFGTSPFRRIA